MTASPVAPEAIERAIDFHGHFCPGLAIGIRAADYALHHFGHASDEEIVAVAETDMCGVDALQALVGCTMGKGNLIVRDLGKVAFSFYRRCDGKAARLLRKPAPGEADTENARLREKMRTGPLDAAEQARYETLKRERALRILAADFDDLFTVSPVQTPLPRPARILETLNCEACGEPVMESRTRRLGGQTLCIPCFEAREQKV